MLFFYIISKRTIRQHKITNGSGVVKGLISENYEHAEYPQFSEHFLHPSANTNLAPHEGHF